MMNACDGMSTNKMAVSVHKFCVAFYVLSFAFADRVPVLIWSSDRSLDDLPKVPAAGSLPQEAFHSGFLTPLLNGGAPILVVFLQDKLNINDISKYADVYNPESDGGAFKNIKGHLKEHFSLELPQVEDSHLAVDKLRHGFPGTVLDLSPTFDLSDLDLQGKGLSLMIVRLHPVADTPSEEAAISVNDELIGKVSRHLEEQSVKYTAVYTAERSHSKQPEKQESQRGRRLLESPQEDKRGAFYNVTHPMGTLYAFLYSVSICIRPRFDPNKPALTSCSVNFSIIDLSHSDMTVEQVSSSTISFTLTSYNIRLVNSSRDFNLTLTMPFEHQHDRWEILESKVSILNGTEGSVKDFRLVTHGYDPVVPLLYSFHCSSMKWYPINMSSPTLVYVILEGFQVQPFNTPSTGFFLSQDCVGWFTTAIWMGLVAVGIHIVILFFGLYMLASLTTNSRYDNPKNKPLTIHAQE